MKKSQSSKEKNSNWDADELLNQHFVQPVRFIIYTGMKDLSKVATKRYLIRGVMPTRKGFRWRNFTSYSRFPKRRCRT